MTQTEKDEALRVLSERQIALQAKMAESDAHAAKCMKLGFVFAVEYPDEYEEYESARMAYNDNEAEIERISGIKVEENTSLEE